MTGANGTSIRKIRRARFLAILSSTKPGSLSIESSHSHNALPNASGTILLSSLDLTEGVGQWASSPLVSTQSMSEQTTPSTTASLPLEAIVQRIYLLRRQKVLLDADLAALYNVPTKRFNEQVKRNMARCPADFMFQLSGEEFAALRSQFATSNEAAAGRGGRRHLPFAFTEHGAIMNADAASAPKSFEIPRPF